MEFLRRPFFVVLIGLVVFISIWYHQESTDVPASAGKQPVECVGRVDDIQMGESGIVLVLSEVQAVQLNSQQNISVKKLLVYDCSKQGIPESLTHFHITPVRGYPGGSLRSPHRY